MFLCWFINNERHKLLFNLVIIYQLGTSLVFDISENKSFELVLDFPETSTNFYKLSWKKYKNWDLFRQLIL